MATEEVVGARAEADVAVIGAGIAGLAAAHRLRSLGHHAVVLEAERVPGGRVRTETWAGCRIELGAMYLTPHYADLMQLVDAAGLGPELVPIQNAFRVAIRRDGGWHHADFRRRPGSPAAAADLARFSALRWSDRLSLARLLLPLLRAGPRLRHFDVATAAAVDTAAIEDVVSPDAARYFMSPLFEVFCGYRPADVVLPLVAMAARYPSTAPLTFRGGMAALSEALAAAVDVRCATTAERIEEDGAGVRCTVHARDADGRRLRLQAGAAIVATPADLALSLLPHASEGTRRLLASTRYSDTFLLYLRTDEAFQPVDPGGRELYMEVVAAEPGLALQSLGFLNAAAPSGGLLLATPTPAARAGADAEALAERMQAEVERLHPELRGVVADRRGIPVPRVVPRFPVGRARELREFRSALGPRAVQLAGDYLYGVCMESAAQAGVAAAERAAAHLARGRAAVTRR